MTANKVNKIKGIMHESYGMTVAIFCILFAITCRISAAEGYVVDGVAARVNERVVTIGDVLGVMRPVHRKLAARYQGKALVTRLQAAYQSALDTLVARALILDAYAEEEREIPGWVVDERVMKIIHDVFDDDRSKLMETLSRDGLTFEEWRDEVRDQIIVSSMRGGMIDQRITVSPEEVRKHYEANRDRYSESSRVKLRMIVIKKPASGGNAKVARDRAEDTVKQLKADYGFAALALEVSEGTRADDGGDWGWIDPKILRKELLDAVLTLKPSEISGVIETRKEFYIVKLEGRRDGSSVPFEEVQPEIERKLRMTRSEKLYQAWIVRLKKDAYVKVFDVSLF